jgi:3-phenylpropionate/cinnamic acid dioxygenase small subunit
MADADTLFRLSGLNAAYAAAIDADRLEAWPDFFTADCRYRITTADNHARGYPAGIIHAEGRGMLLDRVTALRGANIYERQRYRHIIGMPLLGGMEDGLVRAETAFVVVRTMRDGRMDLFAAGLYLDRVHLAGPDRPLFAERVVVCDSQRFDTLLAIPL